MGKTVIISERQLRKIRESVESSNKIGLPKELLKQIYDRKTSLGDNPAFPPDDELRFEEKLLLPTYENVLSELNLLYPDTDIDNTDFFKTELSKLLKRCYDIEKPIKKQLERLVLNIIKKIFEITSDDIDLTIDMVDTIDNKDVKMPLTPEAAEDIEFDGIEDLKGINDYVYKRRVVNCLMQGISNKFIHLYDFYVKEVYELNDELLGIYKRIITLNEYLNFISDANKVNEKKITQGSCSEVIVKSSDRAKITVKGVNFIALLHESIRALLDLISVNGLPDDTKKMKYVLKKSDFRYANYWDLRFGVAMWSKIEEKLGEQEYEDIIPQIFYEIVSKPVKEFNLLLQNVFANTKQGRIELQSIVDGVRYKVDKDNFEKDLDNRRKVIEDEKYLDLNEPVEESVKSKTVIISERQLSILSDNLLLEKSRENKNIELAIKLVMDKYEFSFEKAQQVVTHDVQGLVPNARSLFKAKYIPGITRMYLNDEIDGTNKDKLNRTLKYLEPHIDEDEFKDGYLSNWTADDLIERFKTNDQENLDKDYEILDQIQFGNDGTYNGYEIVAIRSAEEAAQYAGDVSWCVARGSYNTYTNNGVGLFYFLLKKPDNNGNGGYKNIPEQKGENYPLDEYGLSMLAVSVDFKGNLNSCTTRWNKGDNALDVHGISKLIDANFRTVFLPRPKEEILSKIKFDENGYAIQLHKCMYFGLLDENLEWFLKPKYASIKHAYKNYYIIKDCNDNGKNLCDIETKKLFFYENKDSIESIGSYILINNSYGEYNVLFDLETNKYPFNTNDYYAFLISKIKKYIVICRRKDGKQGLFDIETKRFKFEFGKFSFLSSNVDWCITVFNDKDGRGNYIFSKNIIRWDRDGRIENVPVFETTSPKTIIISESQLDKIRKSLLTEDTEGRRRATARKLVMKKQGCSEEEAKKIVDTTIVGLVPNARTLYNANYLPGVTRMYLDGQVTSENGTNLSKALKYLEGHTDYDSNLNGMNADDFIRLFSQRIKKDDEASKSNLQNQQYVKNEKYKIVPIHSDEEARERKYSDYTDWCITRGSYNSYTNNGMSLFYFVLKDGYQKMPEQRGKGCPLDEYGLSMLAIQVDIKGELLRCTTRWNHANGGTDTMMNTDEISKLIGQNFYEAFPPRNKEEMLKNMRFDSDGLAIQSGSDEDGYERWGLMDENLEWVLDPYYDANDIGKVESDGCRIISSDHEGYSLWSRDYGFLLSSYDDDGYDDIYSPDSENIRKVYRQNSGYGLYRAPNEWILEMEYDKIAEPRDDGSRMVELNGNKGFFINGEVNWIELPGSITIEEISETDPDGRTRVQSNGKWGLVNKEFNKWVFPNKWDGISSLYRDGSRAFGTMDDNNRYIGLMDKNLNIVLEPIYGGVSNCEENGMRTVSVKDKRGKYGVLYGLMDQNFKWVLNPEYDSIGELQPDGIRKVQEKGLYGLMDQNFKWVLNPEFIDIYEPKYERGDRWGLYKEKYGKRINFNPTTKQFEPDDRYDESKIKIPQNQLNQIIKEAIEDCMDEATYPSSFNMDEFKALTSFSKRLQYCKTNLEPIASGSGRYVFGIDADTVLKLAKNKKGVAQNEAEYNYANDYYINIVAQVFEVDDNFLWLEMERVSKCTPTKFKQITGMDFNDFAMDIRYEGNRISGKRKNWFRHSERYDENVENEFFQSIADLIGSYDMPACDLTKLSTYGITKNGDIKIVDAGLSEDVLSQFYFK